MNDNFNKSLDCLTNFIGALVSSSSLNNIQTRHHVVSILCSEILKLSKENNRLEPYILKPFIKSNLIILEDWIADLEILTENDLVPLDETTANNIAAQKKFYKETVNGFKKMIENMEKEGV